MKTCLVTFAVLAGAISNALAQAASAATTTPLPQTKSEYWVLGIAAVTPIIVTGIKKVIPKVPKIALPCLTPVIGIALGLGVNWLATQNLAWVDMAQAGALAVFVREVFTNAVTKQLTQSNETTTPTG